MVRKSKPKPKQTSDFLKQLKKDRSYLDDQKKEIVKKIITVTLASIKNINLTGATELIYEVPLFLVGFPLYDVITISGLVSIDLKKMGFRTTFLHPNKIHILWNN